MTDAELSKKRAKAGRKGGKKGRNGGFAANPTRAKFAALKRWHPEMTDDEIDAKLARELTEYAANNSKAKEGKKL